MTDGRSLLSGDMLAESPSMIVWSVVLLMSLLAPVIAAASIASWISLDGPAIMSGNAELLGFGRQVQERYQMMSPDRQALFQELLANPSGR
jgi:hypothetical protein